MNPRDDAMLMVLPRNVTIPVLANALAPNDMVYELLAPGVHVLKLAVALFVELARAMPSQYAPGVRLDPKCHGIIFIDAHAVVAG
jgi:hypothetical protein